MTNFTAVDFDTAYQVLLNSEAADDYMRLCVEYEGYTKSDELRSELVYRYNIAKRWKPIIPANSVPIIKANGHALYLVKVFEMFMGKPNFADVPMRCLVTGKNAQQLQEEDALAAAEAKRKEEERIAQIAEWKSKGLCTRCGGTIKSGLFGAKCLSCKAKY